MHSTIILSYDLVSILLNERRSPHLDRLKIHQFNFIAGPHLINNNHWLALIINMNERKFFLLDPLKATSTNLEVSYNSWLTYYNQRVDHDLNLWKLETLDHPTQNDYFNCGIFVINFIRLYILTGKIQFSTDQSCLMATRLEVSKKIQEFYTSI